MLANFQHLVKLKSNGNDLDTSPAESDMKTTMRIKARMMTKAVQQVEVLSKNEEEAEEVVSDQEGVGVVVRVVNAPGCTMTLNKPNMTFWYGDFGTTDHNHCSLQLY